MYDYREEMANDIRDYIGDELEKGDYSDKEEVYEMLYDKLWTADSVTGNASGSYTFSSYKAKENVFDNMNDLRDTISEFCISADEVAEHFLNEDFEYFDVSIRCYLLGEVLASVLDELEEDGFFDVEDEDN